MAERDLYKILHVPRNASEDQIRSSYRKLARKYHPDINPGNKEAEAKFKEIAAAYDVLSHPAKRKLYDEFGEAGLQPGFDPEKARSYRQWQDQAARSGGHFDFEFGALDDVGDLFEGLFGSRMRPRQRAATRGADMEATVEIDFLDAARGFQTTLSVQRPGPDGSLRQETFRVNIPPGAEEGKRIRIPGKGYPGRAGGKTGDLYIIPRIRPHPFFTRSGRDLFMDLPITLAESIRGSTVQVPTPTGSVKVKIPRGAQSGQTLRIRGKGVPAHGKQPPGDFYVRVMIQPPQRPLSPETLEKIEGAYTEDVRKGIKI